MSQRALGVDTVDDLRIEERQPHTLRGEMKHDVAAGGERAHLLLVEDVGGFQPDARVAGMRRKVFAASDRQVVDHQDVVSPRRQCVDEMAADEAGAAGHEHAARHQMVSPSTARITRAGLPATIARAGTFFVTTLPAPTIAPSPISMPQRIVEPDPIEAPRRTTVGTTCQSAAVCSAPIGRDRARVLVVDEGDRVADEHLILDLHAFADERVARHLDAAADARAALDLDEGADFRVRRRSRSRRG